MLAMMAMTLAATPLPNGCKALRQPLGAAVRTAEAKRITHDSQEVKADGVTLILADGPWRLVWAIPTEAERGVYFYRRTPKVGYRLTDIWGGVNPPEERAETIAWVQKRPGHPPKRIVECMADAVLAGY